MHGRGAQRQFALTAARCAGHRRPCALTTMAIRGSPPRGALRSAGAGRGAGQTARERSRFRTGSRPPIALGCHCARTDSLRPGPLPRDLRFGGRFCADSPGRPPVASVGNRADSVCGIPTTATCARHAHRAAHRDGHRDGHRCHTAVLPHYCTARVRRGAPFPLSNEGPVQQYCHKSATAVSF